MVHVKLNFYQIVFSLTSGILKQPEESEFWQGGSPKFLFGASDHCREARREREQEFWGKADAAKNRFFRLFEYISGKTLNRDLLRIIVAFHEELVIITVMRIT